VENTAYKYNPGLVGLMLDIKNMLLFYWKCFMVVLTRRYNVQVANCVNDLSVILYGTTYSTSAQQYIQLINASNGKRL
jgi:uncharacterized protein involved in cysteine biosynthesis